jgi:uncharacterized protein with von Willebrand factor type A (vWA) domain
MIPAIQRFLERLRAAGVAASPAEAIDAFRAVRAVGLEDRAAFRAALRATVAKDREAQRLFDAHFDDYFRPPARAGKRGKGESAGAGAGEGRGGAGAGGGRPRAEPPEEERRPARGRPRAREREEERPPRFGEPRRRRRLGRLRRVLARRDGPEGDARRRGPATETRRRPLDVPLVEAEERALAAALPRVVEELRLRLSRRRREARRGRLSVHGLFRRNLPSGGVPFVLPFRARRPGRPRITLLVDVSRSCVRAAGLFLLVALAFLERRRGTRVLLFVDRAVDATEALVRWQRGAGADTDAGPRVLRAPPRGPRPTRGRGPSPGAGIVPRGGGPSFARLLESIPDLNLGAPSDYGGVFYDLVRGRRAPAGRGSVLVVLGDGRTNRYDPLAWAFEELTARSGRVLWLCPEPAARWGTGDSALPQYLPACDLAAEVRDLDGIAEGVRALLHG